MTLSLFPELDRAQNGKEELCPGAVVLRGFALPHESALWAALQEVTACAPYRNMVTPGGYRMSVSMTNCGQFGWLSDRGGYRYDRCDPLNGRPWPPMPTAFVCLAREGATEAGFKAFVPDACLINRYEPGARLSLHQDRDEGDLVSPIVSVSIGLPAIFQFGGLTRKTLAVRVPVRHGDVVVWGGPARLRYHGVLPLQSGEHPLTGCCRINLSFRKVC